MKWIALKTYLLSFIEQEVDKVVDKYLNLLKEIKRTNRIEIIREFDELRQSVLNYRYILILTIFLGCNENSRDR